MRGQPTATGATEFGAPLRNAVARATARLRPDPKGPKIARSVHETTPLSTNRAVLVALADREDTGVLEEERSLLHDRDPSLIVTTDTLEVI